MLIAQKNVLFFVIGSSCIFLTSNASYFDQIKKELNDMQTRIQQCFIQQNEITKNSFKQLSIAMEQSAIAIAEHKNSNKVDITIAPLTIKDPSFDAAFEQDNNTLDIHTPAGKITIQNVHLTVFASFDHHIEKEQQDGKSKVMMKSFNQSAAKIANEIALEQASIEYDEAAKQLTVSIPMRKKETVKIPVSIKEATKK